MNKVNTMKKVMLSNESRVDGIPNETKVEWNPRRIPEMSRRERIYQPVYTRVIQWR